MSPIVVDKDAKRHDIVEAALTVFGKKSLESITVSDIAAEAGIAKGAIYLYFASKDDLYMAALEHAFSHLFEEFATHPDIEDPAEQLRHVFLESLEQHEEQQHLLRFFISYLGKTMGTERGRVVQAKLRKSFKRNRAVIEKIYARGVKEGRFKKMRAAEVSASLVSLAEFLPMQWIVDPKAFPLKKTGETAIDIFMQGIVKG
jgi:AcrR family transcriptional regulator